MADPKNDDELRAKLGAMFGIAPEAVDLSGLDDTERLNAEFGDDVEAEDRARRANRTLKSAG